MTTAVKFGAGLTKYEQKRKKYRLLSESRVLDDGTTVYRIQCLHTFVGARKGQKGGWVQHEGNLSHWGDCWVADNAVVSGSASVSGNAQVRHHAKISNSAIVTENAVVSAYSEISGNALITADSIVSNYSKITGNTVVTGYARITTDRSSLISGGCFYDEAEILGSPTITGNPHVYNNAKIHGRVYISGSPKIFEKATLIEEMSDHLIVREEERKSTFKPGIKVSGNAKIYGDAYISGHVDIGGDSEVFGNVYIAGYAVIRDKATVRDNAQVYKKPYIGGLTVVGENCQINGYPHIVGKTRILGSSVIEGHPYISGFGKTKDGVLITGNTCISGFAHIQGSIVINGSYARRHIGESETEFSYRDVKTGQTVTYTKPGLFPLELNCEYGSHISGNTTIWSPVAVYYTDIRLDESYATVVNIHDGKSLSYRDLRKNNPIHFYGEFGVGNGIVDKAELHINGRTYPVQINGNFWSLSVPATTLAHNVDYRLAELTDIERSKPFYLSEHYKDIKRIISSLDAFFIVDFKKPNYDYVFHTRAIKTLQVSVRETTPLQPDIWLDEDTGKSDRDRITKNSKLHATSPEKDFGTVVEYSLDSGTTWTLANDYQLDLPEGEWSSQVVKFRCVDEFGNYSPVVSLWDKITIDKSIQEPHLQVVKDTGASATDLISSEGRVEITPLETDVKLWYSLDNKQTWTQFNRFFELPQGVWEIGSFWVKAEDVAGNLVEFPNSRKVVVDKTISIGISLSDFDDNAVINSLGTGIENINISISSDSIENTIIEFYARDSGGEIHYLNKDDVLVDQNGRVTTVIDSSIFPDGYINLYVAMQDLAGNKAISGASIYKDTVTFIEVEMSSESDSGQSASDFNTSNSKVMFTGRGEPESTVIVTINNTIYASTIVNGNGDFNFITDDLPEGNHLLKIESTDKWGNRAEFIQRIVIDKTAPDFWVSRLIENRNAPVIHGKSEPNVRINFYQNGELFTTQNTDENGDFSVRFYSDFEPRQFTLETEDRAGNKKTQNTIVEVRSRGNNDTSTINSRLIYKNQTYSPTRGITLFGIDKTSTVVYYRTFDTFIDEQQSEMLVSGILELSNNTDIFQIILTTEDEWTTNLTDKAKRAIESLDVDWLIISNPEYRSSLIHVADRIKGNWSKVNTTYKPRYSSTENVFAFNIGVVEIPSFVSVNDQIEFQLSDEKIFDWDFTNSQLYSFSTIGTVHSDSESLVLNGGAIQLNNPYLHLSEFAINTEIFIPTPTTDIENAIVFNYENDWELGVSYQEGSFEISWAVWGNNNNSWKWIVASNQIIFDKWIKISYIVSKDRFSLYIDGVEVYTESFTRKINTSCEVFTIGGRSCIINQATSMLNMKIKRMSIWSRPLTQQEVEYLDLQIS